MDKRKRIIELLVVFIFLVILIFFHVYVDKATPTITIQNNSNNNQSLYFNTSNKIIIYSRESGSGVQKKFIEYFEINKDAFENIFSSVYTKKAFYATSSTSLVNKVASDQYGIGYTTLSSLEGNVDAISINNIRPSLENVKNGTYDFVLPYYILYDYIPSGITEDFLNYLSTREAKDIISKKYIAEDHDLDTFSSKVVGGDLEIDGSSSMEPLMMELVAAYKIYNPEANIKIIVSNSDAASTKVMNNQCDIAMVSRELNEKENSIYSKKIATDAIVVIKNRNNSLTNLTKSDVRRIYSGILQTWKDIFWNRT